jgi:peptidoglycan/LPS O-acetylase OafA/YrhL
MPIDRSDVAYYAAFAALLVLTLASWLARDAKESRTDTWLGELSYPLFLAHGPVIIAATSALLASGLKVGFEATLLILVGLSAGAAALLTIYVERPLMGWRRRHQNRSMPGGAVWSQRSASSSAATSSRA